jgi:hypothetical protein
VLAHRSVEGLDSQVVRRTRFLQLAGACVLSEHVIGACLLKRVPGCFLSPRVPGLAAHQPRHDARQRRSEFLPHRNW